MPLTTQGRNDLLNNGLTSFTHVSAMSDLGTTEVSGVTRQPVTWATAASGQRSNSAQLTIPVGVGQTVQVVSIHSALSAGNVEAWMQIGSAVRGVGSIDAIASDVIQSNGHGLVADDRIFITPVAGESLPSGLSATTLYFVRATGLAADSFTIATTSGGAAVDVTSLGEVAFFKTVPQPFPSGGSLVIATSQLVIDLTFA
jgi:hypothetical protein